MKPTEEKVYTISDLIKNPFQLFFITIALLLGTLVVPFVQKCIANRTEYLAHVPEGYTFPNYHDFTLSLKVCFLFAILEYAFKKVVY